MYIILNQEGEKIGYINNMIILDETKEKVLGILIGDCFLVRVLKLSVKFLTQLPI